MTEFILAPPLGPLATRPSAYQLGDIDACRWSNQQEHGFSKFEGPGDVTHLKDHCPTVRAKMLLSNIFDKVYQSIQPKTIISAGEHQGNILKVSQGSFSLGHEKNILPETKCWKKHRKCDPVCLQQLFDVQLFRVRKNPQNTGSRIGYTQP